MGNVAILAEGLGKQYRIGGRQHEYRTLRDVVADTLALPFRRAGRLLRRDTANGRKAVGTIWALKDISFEIKQGEVVGIIGPNGAGKSTLLKILSHITEPTEGYADVYGRVGSLLEVGTGFHPELTGRENIFLNGAILGMKRAEIARKFDEIVAFAEIERFIDTPVKHYSSGMFMRLAFAVAAHLEPEILLVDEVLAVGDMAFQKKCLGKMGAVAQEGRTVLFVSHNMAAVRSLCERAMLLHASKRVMTGPAAQVVQFYLEGGAGASGEQIWADVDRAPGNDKARVMAVRILDPDGQPVHQTELSTPLLVEVDYVTLVPNVLLNVSMSLFNQEDAYVLASPSITDHDWFQEPHPVGLFRSRCSLPGNFLNQGRYSVTVILVENGLHAIAHLDRVVSIDMIDLGNTRAGYFGYWGGVVRPILEWQTSYLGPSPVGAPPHGGAQWKVSNAGNTGPAAQDQ